MTNTSGTREVGARLEYVAGQAACEFPALPSDTAEEAAKARHRWHQHLASLDTAFFSVLGDSIVLDAEAAATLE